MADTFNMIDTLDILDREIPKLARPDQSIRIEIPFSDFDQSFASRLGSLCELHGALFSFSTTAPRFVAVEGTTFKRWYEGGYVFTVFRATGLEAMHIEAAE